MQSNKGRTRRLDERESEANKAPAPLRPERAPSTTPTSAKLSLRLLRLLHLVLLSPVSPVSPSHAVHEHLCLDDDYTNDLPIFIEKRSICNYDSTPVHVYSIKITPDTDYETKFCLKGEYAETFNITEEKELKLYGRLEQPETHLKLQIIRTANDIVGTPGERRQAINAIQFVLAIEDCNHVSWQTIVVAILSSVCVALMSTLAIMLILYQQKGFIRSGIDEDRVEEMPYQASDEGFINPRKTSSYDFNTLSKHSESPIELVECEKL